MSLYNKLTPQQPEVVQMNVLKALVGIKSQKVSGQIAEGVSPEQLLPKRSQLSALSL